MSPTRRFDHLVALCVVLSLFTVGCLSASRIETTRPAGNVLSPKLSPFVYFEDGPTLFIGVDGRAAQYAKNEGAMFPLGVGLANQSRSGLTFSRESFVLETADGKRYPLVSVQEYNRDYSRSSSDRRLADTFLENLGLRFQNYNFVQQQVFPYRGSAATANTTFELGRLFWTHFYLYFPMPEEGIHGREFNLLVSATEVPDTFVVRFKLK